MSEQRDDEFKENQFEEFDLGGVDGDETKNRPATGSTFAESTEELDLDWKGSSAATDFLGIEGEVKIDDVPAPIGSALDTSGTAGLPADSWLHGIEDREEAALAAASTASSPQPKKTERLLLDDLPALREPPRSRSFGLKLAAACLVLAFAGGGFWYWKTQHTGRTDSTPVDMATKPTKPTPKPTAVTTKTSPNVTTDPVAPTPTNTDPIGSSTEPIEIVSTEPTNGTTTEPTLPDVPVEVTPTISFPDPANQNPTNEPTNTVTSSEPVSLPTTLRVPPASEAPIPGAVRRATEADFAHLWREQAVPKEAIAGDKKLRTINVGQVRVMLDSGEYFEGALYAVGQNRVWLDLDLGRIAFEAASVRDITRIATTASATAMKKSGLDLSGCPHVEARLPGGWVAGRLVGREGNVITLVTNEGIRMVIETDEVRPITARKTRVLGSVEKLGGFTGKSPEAPKKP